MMSLDIPSEGIALPEDTRQGHGSNDMSGLDHILPHSITRLDRPLQHVPKMERSMSMVDSVMMESLVSENGSSRPQSPLSNGTEDSRMSSPVPRDETPTGVSGLAHLSLIKNQRNALRSELRAQKVASAEAKASVTALRRLAFRLAVNIAVKERQISHAVQQLATHRKADYVESRNAEKQIADLKRSLREEERRNKETLELLEKASRQTMQCMLLLGIMAALR